MGMTREEAIKQLRLLKGDITFGIASKVENKNQIEALSIAIASLETDEAYQLEYESTTKNNLSSGTRKNSQKLENVSPIIDWNNCHTSEQLDSIATTKNDLGVDAVSRDEVCRYVAEFVNHEFSTREEEELIDNIITGIEHMPSVTPQEPKTGHWIYLKNNKARCSECDDVVLIAQMYGNANYCPNCGAKMEEVEE